LFLLVLAGCPPRADVRTTPVPDAMALLGEVEAIEARVAALQSQARVRVESGGKRGNLTAFVAVAAPASVHLEVLDFFGRPSAILVSDGQRFVLYQAETGIWLRGPATPENLARILPVALPPEELVAMLLGRAPRIADTRPELQIDAEANAFRVILRSADRSQQLWVDPGTRRVVRSQLSGPSGYGLTFEDFTDIRQVPFPRKLGFTGPATVVLEYTDPRLGEGPPASLFRAEPPTGARVEEVGPLR
jgi:outer membrane lipoprotein-sorting protein